MKKILLIVFLCLSLTPQVEAIPIKVILQRLESRMNMQKRHREFKKRKKQRLKYQKSIYKTHKR